MSGFPWIYNLQRRDGKIRHITGHDCRIVLLCGRGQQAIYRRCLQKVKPRPIFLPSIPRIERRASLVHDARQVMGPTIKTERFFRERGGCG